VVEILLLTAGYGDKPAEPRLGRFVSLKGEFCSPAKTNQGILPADYFRPHVGFAARSQTPTTGTEGLVQDSTILNFWEIKHTILKVMSGQQEPKS
jgi:hypothetical protein